MTRMDAAARARAAASGCVVLDVDGVLTDGRLLPRRRRRGARRPSTCATAHGMVAAAARRRRPSAIISGRDSRGRARRAWPSSASATSARASPTSARRSTSCCANSASTRRGDWPASATTRRTCRCMRRAGLGDRRGRCPPALRAAAALA
ncbi:MAG: hypothetical protein MZW92_04015 [Comamonadaceae bacterium]|nr:hypothetical protein [Comamonadaceae bacterium]